MHIYIYTHTLKDHTAHIWWNQTILQIQVAATVTWTPMSGPCWRDGVMTWDYGVVDLWAFLSQPSGQLGDWSPYWNPITIHHLSIMFTPQHSHFFPRWAFHAHSEPIQSPFASICIHLHPFASNVLGKSVGPWAQTEPQFYGVVTLW